MHVCRNVFGADNKIKAHQVNTLMYTSADEANDICSVLPLRAKDKGGQNLRKMYWWTQCYL